MARASVQDRLRHISDAIDRLERMTAGKSFDDYAADVVLHDAVERNIERVSEASRHIPAELKAGAPEIPWIEVAAVGSILRHDYGGVSDDRVWSILHDDIPVLKAAIQMFLSKLP